ncbi:hypothetical protein E2562_008833 [Oryza meyeriana var. granulata]|uniref:DUF4220 domain-containing protein n=1 Tax=Oryza meyeriana var. granulata TaxID=110450 RepID=A0A6G1D060_9ORYZ|nr:hypothetical protein E2562_008833 [Oryza meyeriana var. granulata]
MNAVQWWDEWQLRILVLGSLGIQWFLLLAAPMRKYTIPHWFRTFIWLAYISSDAVAIYALATLFNRHAIAVTTAAKRRCLNGSILEVLWAPVLLIHLGGQQEMSAYDIEDNELWRRHTVTLVSQVTVAIYAFYKSWPANGGDGRLLASAILLFVIGVLSFTEKPWALRRASINRLAAVSSMVQAGTRVSKWWYCFAELENDKCGILGRYYRKEDKQIPPLPGVDTEVVKRSQQHMLTDRDKVLLILSDMSLLAADSDLKQDQRRRRQRRSLVGEDDGKEEVEGDLLGTLSPRAERSFKRWLRRAFGLIYTRANVVLTPAYLAYHLLFAPFLHITAITLFATSGKRHYNAIDVKITYVLLCLTAALDILAESIRQLLFKLMSMADVPALCETVPQYNNLIGSALHRTQPAGILLRCAAHVGYKEGFFVCRRRNLYHMLAGLIFSDLVGANARGLDFTSYRSFAPGRRNWVLNDSLRKACGQEVEDSLRGSFDRGVILWHIATDLCIRRMTTDNNIDDIDKKFLECTEAISDYMAHLLNLRPDMLMTGSRQHLFSQAMEELELILKDIESQQQSYSLKTLQPDILAKEIIDKARAEVGAKIDVERVRERGTDVRVDEPLPPKYPLVHDACRLAEELMDKMDRKMRCQVMYRVWVGMLFYSASMCRGYLHAKSLGEGGEFLSFVWLILSLKGAKTLADKLQMPEPEPEPKLEPKPGPYQEMPQGEPTAAVATPDDDGEDLSFLLRGSPRS